MIRNKLNDIDRSSYHFNILVLGLNMAVGAYCKYSYTNTPTDNIFFSLADRDRNKSNDIDRSSTTLII